MTTDQERQALTRRQTYEQAHRRIVINGGGGYRSAAALQRAVMDVLRDAALADAAMHGVEIMTPGQAAIERAWGKLPACETTLCGDDGDFGLAGHHHTCRRGIAIRRLHGDV